MSVSWNVDPALYLEQLTRQKTDAIERDIVRLVDQLSNQAAAWMKANHRWQNITTNAEQGLYADIEHVVRESVTLLMSHGPAVEYAWYLETVSSGRFAVLPDASDHFWPLLYRGVVEIVRRQSS